MAAYQPAIKIQKYLNVIICVNMFLVSSLLTSWTSEFSLSDSPSDDHHLHPSRWEFRDSPGSRRGWMGLPNSSSFSAAVAAASREPAVLRSGRIRRPKKVLSDNPGHPDK